VVVVIGVGEEEAAIAKDVDDPRDPARELGDPVDRAPVEQGRVGRAGDLQPMADVFAERILWLKHGRIIRLGRLLILSGLLNAILILFFVAPSVKARLTQARPAASVPSGVTPVDKVGESSARPLR
jgi:hypothetical protein